MPKNAVYYYDHEAGTFVTVEPSIRSGWLKGGAVVALILVIGAVGAGALVQAVATPVEVAQRDEIDVLRGELAAATTYLDRASVELDRLAETADLNQPRARPVSDVRPRREASDARLARYSAPTRELLARTAGTFERVERQLGPQRRAAVRRAAALRQTPAILPVRDARMTSGYGMRVHPLLQVMRLHAGVDFAAAPGTPVYATADGRVSFVGTRDGYGTVVEIDHPRAGRMTRFAHLTSAAPGIRAGVAVRRGQVVASSGHSGVSTAPHLHYEVRALDADRTPTDPAETFVASVTPAE